MYNLPKNHFAAIAADPPWPFVTRSVRGKSRSQEAHYQTMPIDEIAALPVEAIAADDCYLFLWVVGPSLFDAQRVIAGWGFTYSGFAFNWIKLRRGINPLQTTFLEPVVQDTAMMLGYQTRKNSELCLLGRRGKPQRLDKGVREIILEPAREHSRKPEQFYSSVERFCAGPRIELFSRQSRDGWTTWGNETGKFDRGAA